MDITRLKKGFWGYKKSDVCEYIAKMNEKFSLKMMDTITAHEQAVQEFNKKIARLEQENAAFYAERDRVAEVLTDAKMYAVELKQKANAENAKFLEKNLECAHELQKRIRECSAGIHDVRDSIQQLLDIFGDNLSEKSEVLSEPQHFSPVTRKKIEKGGCQNEQP